MNRPNNRNRNNNNNNNKNKPNNRRGYRSKPNNQTRQQRPKKTTSPDKIVKAYYILIEKLQIARRKYYDDFHHQDPNRVRKLRRIFESTIAELREWENALEPEQQKLISNLKDSDDQTYSTINSLSPIGENEVAEEEVRDPHFITKQKEAIDTYKEDTEESVGTMDDYRSYKGI